MIQNNGYNKNIQRSILLHWHPIVYKKLWKQVALINNGPRMQIKPTHHNEHKKREILQARGLAYTPTRKFPRFFVFCLFWVLTISSKTKAKPLKLLPGPRILASTMIARPTQSRHGSLIPHSISIFQSFLSLSTSLFDSKPQKRSLRPPWLTSTLLSTSCRVWTLQ